jgi:hypothetical protein
MIFEVCGLWVEKDAEKHIEYGNITSRTHEKARGRLISTAYRSGFSKTTCQMLLNGVE